MLTNSTNLKKVQPFNTFVDMKREISYFRSVLEQYLNEHHPEMTDSASFIESRAEEALTVYADAVKNGSSHLEAEELANEVLYKGLHFSGYDMIVEVLWNEFQKRFRKGLRNGWVQSCSATRRLGRASPNTALMTSLTASPNMTCCTRNLRALSVLSSRETNFPYSARRAIDLMEAGVSSYSSAKVNPAFPRQG